MKLSSKDYLCTIPVLEPPSPENKTANELAEQEEARETVRATAKGWELLGELEGRCLYFGSGWWTYKFCKNREIVQFHAAAVSAPGQPPRRDPSTAEYVLGAVPAIPMMSSHNQQRNSDTKPLPAEVQYKGEQRYLLQRLEGGTICDLTGRERTIEVQYHCVPGLKEPRIAWIKEVTICAYLMVVNMPTLCEDAAFLPPKETKANPIKCQLVVGNDVTPPLIEEKEAESQKVFTDVGEVESQNVASDKGVGEQPPLKASETKQQVVGGVVVGARNFLSSGDEDGKPPIKLTTPNAYAPNTLGDEDLGELIARAASKAKGGKIEILGIQELEEMDIDPQVLAELREEVERLAGEQGWRIEVVELPNEDREIRGYVDEEEKEEGDSKEKPQEGSEEKFYKDEL